MIDSYLSFFFLLVIGAIAGFTKLVDQKALDGINRFVIYFALPALIIHFMASQSLSRLWNTEFFILFSLTAIMLFFLSILVMQKWLKTDRKEVGVLALASSWANEGYMGIPLLIGLMGETGLKIALWAVFVDQIISTSLTTYFMEKHKDQARTPSFAFFLSRFLQSPFILTVLIGVICASLPREYLFNSYTGFVWAGLDLLGQAASPTALFAIGVSLASVQLKGDSKVILAGTGLKLIIHPCLVLLLMHTVIPVDVEIAYATLLISVLPSAGTAYAFSARYGVGQRRVSSIIFVTTILSVPLIYLVMTKMQQVGVIG